MDQKSCACTWIEAGKHDLVARGAMRYFAWLGLSGVFVAFRKTCSHASELTLFLHPPFFFKYKYFFAIAKNWRTFFAKTRRGFGHLGRKKTSRPADQVEAIELAIRQLPALLYAIAWDTPNIREPPEPSPHLIFVVFVLKSCVMIFICWYGGTCVFYVHVYVCILSLSLSISLSLYV